MSQVLILYRLQKIDTQRDQITARLVEIQNQLNSSAAMVNAQAAFDQASQNLAASRRVLHSAEDAVQLKRIKLEQDESALYGGRIRNPKELQDLQNEVASLKKHLAELEDQQLEAMVALEQVETGHGHAAKSFEAAKSAFAQQKASLEHEQATLKHDLVRLESERQAAASAVSAENQKLYERLRQQKRGLAVASLSDDSCDACGSTLTPGEKQASRSPSQIFLCPSCGRILYAG